MIKIAGHIVLSVVMLISSAGMTIDMHFCRDQLIDLAIFGPAHSCCGADDGTGHCQMDMGNSGHCDDETIRIESIHDFLGSAFAFDFEDDHSSELFFNTKLFFNTPVPDEFPFRAVAEYRKPPPYQEVSLSDIQSFLL